jgi:hypothetical protein
MSYAQFQALMEAISSVRHDLTERLDRIDGRLREVEEFQAQEKALSESRQQGIVSVRWKLGIAVSTAGVITTLVLQLIRLGGQ